MKMKSLARCTALVLALAWAPNYSEAHDRENHNDRNDSGVIYTMDNSAEGNHVLAYARGADGRLEAMGVFASEGRGTSTGLGSQGAVVLSSNGRWLFACNAGSDEISVFRVEPNGLILTHKLPSGGARPISLALHGNILFALNAGGQAGAMDNVSGFLFYAGSLYPLPDATHRLSADSTNPAQIGFSRGGELLIVTEKDTALIDVFTLDNDGSIADAKFFQSSGQTPFGFALRGDDLFVSEAFGGATDGSAVSSYDLDREGDLEVISGSVGTTETSACWVVATGNGRFVYAANTGSGSITGYSVTPVGSLSLLEADGVTGITGADSSPADMTLSANGRFLYSRNGNGTISAFQVNDDGSLIQLSGVSGLSAGGAGLAGR